MPTVRQATSADADAIGRVHVEAWQAAYQGVMPAAHLDGLDVDRRARMWHDRLRHPDPEREVLVADDAGAVVGFAVVGPTRGGALGEVGELQALNVAPAVWRGGIGGLLLARAEAALVALGCVRARLWVVGANEPARRFYERAGWVPTGEERTEELLGVVIDEVAYAKALVPGD